MDVIESHAARLPAIDDRWTPGPHEHDELVAGLLEGRVAGPVTSHPMDNVRRNIQLLFDGDPDKQFGMTGLAGAMDPWPILQAVGREAGFAPDPQVQVGPTPVDPECVLSACHRAGDRLALACEREERVLLATGHPAGPMLLYGEVGRQLVARGVRLLRPYEGESWEEEGSHQAHEVRYLSGVALLTDKANAKHTHSGEPMRRMLDALEAPPDLVFADHGFAGAAIEAGIDTVSIADVNDPALVVAKELGRTGAVIVMDDNVQPDAYWPCFQAIVSRLP
jgi:hypothetical protein